MVNPKELKYGVNIIDRASNEVVKAAGKPCSLAEAMQRQGTLMKTLDRSKFKTDIAFAGKGGKRAK